MRWVHCQNTKCKYYWEDSCTKNMNGETVCIDAYGKCFSFKEGRSEWYEEAEKAEKEEN